MGYGQAAGQQHAEKQVKHREIEFKYNADNISLTEFQAFCEDREPFRTVVASGYDHFYQNSKDAEAFCRVRRGPDMNQLTFKRKTSGANNNIRVEHNIDLVREMEKDSLTAFLGEFGYKYEKSIFKNCFVYKYNDHVLVYYICYDVNLKELGRFIEIEADEDFPWESQQAATNTVVALERICKPLGITPQGRMRKSLFEMFAK